ncbi:Sensor protein FixL [Symmachiella macrocystis]|uniref:histidine kinase n=1 Tax=Symmachiella macrocystis TaxID=2527985 RepID=A0A5C6B3V1_9PLAN|nr:PAS domain S-box protein [Symmachiella macrocystis]TWU06833.1 Sensor protein FixL [Symmachiella macrocystis]
MTNQECCDAFYDLLRQSVVAAQPQASSPFAKLGRQAACAEISLMDVVRLLEKAQSRLVSEQPELTLNQFAKVTATAMSETLAGYDSTERQVTAIPPDSLHEIARQYTSTAMSHQIGVWDWDLQTNDLFIDPCLKEILGYQDHEIPNRLEAWSELVHPDDRERTRGQSQASLENDERSFEFEQRLVHKNGQALWFVCRGRIIRNAECVPIRLLGTNTNVTAAKLVAAEIRNGVDRYHALIETVPYGIQEFNLDGVLLYCNSACDRMLGYRPGERIGRSVLDLLPTQQESDDFCRYFKMCRTEQPPAKPLITRHRAADGRVFYVQMDWDYKRNASGQVVGYISVITDMTERRQYEKSLRAAQGDLERRVAERTAALEASESRWRSMVQAAPDYLVTVDRSARITYANRTPVGVPGKLLHGRSVFDLADAAYRDELQTLMNEVFTTGEFASVEALARGPRGKRHWYSIRYGPIFRDGEVDGVSIFATDIDERKQAEASLNEAHQLLEAIFDNTQFLIAYLDVQLNYLMVNRAWSEAAEEGICPRFVPGNYFFDVYRNEELRTIFQSVIESTEPHSEWAKPFANVLDSQKPVTYWNWALTPVKDRGGKVIGLIVTLLDVTHRVLADETIRKSKERLQAAQEMAHLGNWDWNLETSQIEWSDEMFRIFEVSAEGFNGSFLRYLDIVHPDDRKLVSETFAKAIEKTGLYSIDYRVVLPSGTEKHVHGQAKVTYDDSGNAIMLSGTTQDVTARVQAEEELRNSESMLRALLEAIPDMIFRVHRDGTLLDFIPAADSPPYLPREEFLGKKIEDVLPPYVAQLSVEAQRKAAETGKAQVIEYRLDLDGIPHDYETRILVGAKDDLLAIVRDVSAERQAEERSRRHRDELAHVTRLSTMGEMATGIAHELNQPISGIASYAAACLMMLESASATPHSEKLSEVLSKIEAQAQRAGEIVRRLRKLVVRRDSMYHAVDLDDAIREVVALVDADVAQSGVEVRIGAPDEVPGVLADRIQIEQVILNLVRNAIEAMEVARIQQPLLAISVSATTDEMIDVEVADNGPGIASTDVDRVFEQFYSTKDNGMGMGLSISRTIIEAHGGRLYVANTSANGTMFRFSLPVIERTSL